MAGGPQQQMQDQQQMPYGPPKKGSNAGVFVGIGVGVVVLILVVVAIVLSSGPSPQDFQKQKTEENAKKLQEAADRRDEETRKANEAIQKPTEAAMAQAADVFNAVKNEDAATLETMFDWQTYAAYNQSLIDKDKEYLNSPLLAVGTWTKDSTGKYTGAFAGEVAHGPDSLKARVMGYLKEHVFGAEDLEWDRTKTESKEAGDFSIVINGVKYYGKRVYFTYKGAGKSKELWLVAPAGTENVRIVNYFDGSSIKNLQSMEAKNERTDDRDPYNPDRDPRNPDRDPRNPDRDPTDPDNPPVDPDADLPQVGKTGAMPTAAALVNAVKELERGGDLNSARIRSIEGESSKTEKKATMGAFIDLLIDAHSKNDRTMKLRISSALYEVWRPFVPLDWRKEDMVYVLDNFGTQSELDIHIRRWLEVYNSYETE